MLPPVNSYWRRPDSSAPWDMHIVKADASLVTARDPDGRREWQLDSTSFGAIYTVQVTPNGEPVNPQNLPRAEFKPGDVVVLKSGGMRMTVQVAQRQFCFCVWQDADGTPRDRWYPDECLTAPAEFEGTP